MSAKRRPVCAMRRFAVLCVTYGITCATGCWRADPAHRDAANLPAAAHPFAKYEGRWAIAGEIPHPDDPADGRCEQRGEAVVSRIPGLARGGWHGPSPKPAFSAAVRGSELVFFSLDPKADGAQPVYKVMPGEHRDWLVLVTVSPPTKLAVPDSIRHDCMFDVTEVAGEPLHARENLDGTIDIEVPFGQLGIDFADDGGISHCHRHVSCLRSVIKLRRTP